MASRQKACASLHGIISPDSKGFHIEKKAKFQALTLFTVLHVRRHD